MTSESRSLASQFLVRVLQTRATTFILFQAKLQKLIHQLFSPGEEDEVIALAVLGRELTNEERDDNINNTNSFAIDFEDDPQQLKTRRKSFGDGLCNRTLKVRFADLDDKIISGTIYLLNSINCVEEDTDLLLAWHEDRLSTNTQTILTIGTVTELLKYH